MSSSSSSSGGAAAEKAASRRRTCETICVAFTMVIFAAVAATLLYFGIAYRTAECAEPLPLWCLIAGGIILGTSVVFLLDYLIPSWKGLLYQLSAEKRKGEVATWFTVLSILEVTLLVSFVATFIYGAYAVLAIFGRQRNATPGTEVCNRQLYDPLFFIIILFDLVLVIGVLLLLCLNCDALCCCWTDPQESSTPAERNRLLGNNSSGGASASSEATTLKVAAAGGDAAGSSGESKDVKKEA
jgi:hypothetical protein